MKKVMLLIAFTNILFANVITLKSGEAKAGNVAKGVMSYYKISAKDGDTVKTIMDNLTADGDLYVKIGSKPTTSSYECRSIHTNTRAEDCSVSLVTNSDVFIGIQGYNATAYHIKATIQGGNNNIPTLDSGIAVSSSVSNGETKYYKIVAKQGQTLTSLLNGLTHDADLYVKVGAKATSNNFDCKSTNGDTNSDSCNIKLNENADVFIAVYGYRASDYKITATLSGGNGDSVTTLVSGVSTAGSVTKEKMKYYKIAVQAGKKLTSLLNGLTADSDIYVKIGEKPTLDNYDCNSENGGTNSDSCSFVITENSDVYIAVYGFQAANYNITATLKDNENGNITSLVSGTAVAGSIIQGEMKYYKIAVTRGKTITSLLNGLNADLDLYVKIGNKPTTGIFDCKSENGGINSDSCSLTPNANSVVYLGVYGYRTSNYQIKATIKDNEVPGGEPLVVYEDAEDRSIARWTITDNIPANATVTNIHDTDKNSRVIKFNSSDSYENQYQMNVAWNNRENFNLIWDMKTTDGYIIDLEVTTTAGARNLRYNDNKLSYRLKDDTDIIHGLGYHSTDGTWHTFRRDLSKDLKDLEPNNSLVSIDSFSIRAKASIDNIELFTSPNKVYENAEDSQTNRWSVYAGPNGAQINNSNDASRGSKVISFQGNDAENRYIIGNKAGQNNAWVDTTHNNLKWSFKSSSNFKIYLFVNTQKGKRQIKYTNTDIEVKGTQDNEIYFGLGTNTSDGKWHTYIRDIAADLKQFDNDNRLLSIDGFLVVGNSKIDDLELFNVFKPKNHKAGFSLTFDDYDVNGWYSIRDTYLKYNVKATFFVSHFHTISAAEITKLKTLKGDGHEIGCHTFDHEGIGRDYNYDSNRIDAYLNKQIIPALNNMKNAGFNPVSLAYPFGERNNAYDDAVRAYFPNLRTTASSNNRKLFQLDEIFHKKGKHYTILAGDGIDNSYANEVPEIRSAFIKARENGEIITFYGHQVLDEPNNVYAVSPQKLKKIIIMAQEMGIEFYTFKKAYSIGQ